MSIFYLGVIGLLPDFFVIFLSFFFFLLHLNNARILISDIRGIRVSLYIVNEFFFFQEMLKLIRWNNL